MGGGHTARHATPTPGTGKHRVPPRVVQASEGGSGRSGRRISPRRPGDITPSELSSDAPRYTRTRPGSNARAIRALLRRGIKSISPAEQLGSGSGPRNHSASLSNRRPRHAVPLGRLGRVKPPAGQGMSETAITA